MKLSIVTICYNTLDLILSCVDSLEKQFVRELKDSQIEIIVVDNSSEKEVSKKLEEQLNNKPGVKLIKSKDNLGFGGGNNLGVEEAKGKYVLFLNSDTNVSDRKLLKMVDFIEENPKVGIVGGKLINFDGTPQKSVGNFYNLFSLAFSLFGGGRMGLDLKSPTTLEKVDWVSGACMMANREVFKGLGGFDKNIFMYMEDMELCFRMKKNGFQIYFFPEALVKHKERGSSNRAFAVVNIYKGILYFFKKHKSNMEYSFAKAMLKAKALTVYLLGSITNNSYYTKTYEEVLKTLNS